MKRENFMKPADKAAMKDLPRQHNICIDKTGVARPGKTAHERYKRARSNG